MTLDFSLRPVQARSSGTGSSTGLDILVPPMARIWITQPNFLAEDPARASQGNRLSQGALRFELY